MQIMVIRQQELQLLQVGMPMIIFLNILESVPMIQESDGFLLPVLAAVMLAMTMADEPETSYISTTALILGPALVDSADTGSMDLSII